MDDNTILRPPIAYDEVLARLDEIGTPMTETEIRYTHVILSRRIGGQTGRRSATYGICRMLAAAASSRVVYENGDVLKRGFDAIEPDGWLAYPNARGWPHGSNVMSRLDLRPEHVDELWAIAKDDYGPAAALPLELVLAFFPASIWPVAPWIIREGPERALARLDKALRSEARRVARSGPRAGKRISKGTLQIWGGDTVRFFKEIVDARSLVLDGCRLEGLEEWMSLPHFDLRSLPSPPGNVDRSAPDLSAVRLAVARLFDALDEHRATAQGRERMWKLLQGGLAGLLAVAFGPRSFALGDLHFGDYEPDHRFPDGVRGPALRIRPYKGNDPEHVEWKALPQEVADLLEEWLAYAGIGDDPSETLWKPFRTGGSQRGVSAQRRINTYCQSIFGVPPHRLRHLASQTAAWGFQQYLNAEQGRDPLLARLIARDGITAVLSHKVTNSLEHRYGDFDKMRDAFAREAILRGWELIAGDAGARLAPDPDAIRAGRIAVEGARDAVQAVSDRLSAVEDEIDLHYDAVNGLSLDDDVHDAEVLREIRRQVRTSAERAVLRRSRERLRDEKARLEDDLADAEKAFAEVCERRVPVADDVPDATVADIHARAEAERAGLTAPTRPAGRELRREWLSVAEFAWSISKSEVTVRRWVSGASSPYWSEAERDRVIEVVSPRRRRVHPLEIRAELVPPLVRERWTDLLSSANVGVPMS